MSAIKSFADLKKEADNFVFLYRKNSTINPFYARVIAGVPLDTKVEQYAENIEVKKGTENFVITIIYAKNQQLIITEDSFETIKCNIYTELI